MRRRLIPKLLVFVLIINLFTIRKLIDSGILKKQLRKKSYAYPFNITNAAKFPPPYRNASISAIATCHDRTGFLNVSLPTWLQHREIGEIVIVDWYSEVSLLSLSDRYTDPRIKWVRLTSQSRRLSKAPFVLTRALNLAANISTLPYILKLDCDTVLSSKFIMRHPFPLPPSSSETEEQEVITTTTYPPNYFYSGNFKYARNKNELHLNGIMYLHRNHFFAVGGYNELLVDYGWDDDDMYLRLTSCPFFTPPLNQTGIDYDTVSHQPHSDNIRKKSTNPSRDTTQYTEASTKLDLTESEISSLRYSDLSIYKNRFLTEYVFPKWSNESRKSEYRIRQITIPSSLSSSPSSPPIPQIYDVQILYQPSSQTELIPPSILASAYEFAFRTLLELHYQIPRHLLNRLNHKELEYLWVLYRVNTGRVVIILDQLKTIENKVSLLNRGIQIGKKLGRKVWVSDRLSKNDENKEKNSWCGIHEVLDFQSLSESVDIKVTGGLSMDSIVQNDTVMSDEKFFKSYCLFELETENTEKEQTQLCSDITSIVGVSEEKNIILIGQDNATSNVLRDPKGLKYFKNIQAAITNLNGHSVDKKEEEWMNVLNKLQNC
ncbi:hypothetical protein BKA69DRAFT_1123603 [Paraphysoderma sedebokerense]|nr:hypothetical protein BKA69DRAFT_1123603 [Paraphysoderma sedebokerense]